MPVPLEEKELSLEEALDSLDKSTGASEKPLEALNVPPPSKETDSRYDRAKENRKNQVA